MSKNPKITRNNIMLHTWERDFPNIKCNNAEKHGIEMKEARNTAGENKQACEWHLHLYLPEQ